MKRKTDVPFLFLLLVLVFLAATFAPSAFASGNCAQATYGVVGQAFDSGPITGTSGTPPFVFSAIGTLPAGLTLNTSTGEVSGTPTAAGAFSIETTDSFGVVGPAPCSMTIANLANSVFALGLANAYNLISLTGDINDAADITGRIAAAGQVPQATTIGSDLRNGDPYYSYAAQNGGPYAIIAAGGIPTSNSFNVNAGGNVYSSTDTSAGFNFANENYFGSLYVGSQLVVGGNSPLNFSKLESQMNTLSGQLAGMNANGVVCSVNHFGAIIAENGCPSNPVYFNSASQHYNPSWLVLYGTNPTINIFNLTQDQFQAGNLNLDIEVSTGSTVIVNVAGASATLSSDLYFQGNTVTNANAGTLLFNFPNAAQVIINGQFDGTLLAPYANLSGNSQMGGLFIAASIGSTGEVHYVPFSGVLPWSGTSSSLTITCAAVNIGTVGTAFDSGPMSVTGGTAPYTYSIVGTLPDGLSLNPSTGEITGTPTSSGTFSVKVTDANGSTGTACAITIKSPVSAGCAAVTTGDVGVPFDSGPLSATGGTAPYTYSVVGALPAGLTLNVSTGEVAGTPTAGGTFSIKVTDANGATSTSCAITINGPLSVTCAAVNTGEVGVVFNSGPMTVSGGTAPYTYSVVGTLPAGLTLNTSTGAVTGTPTSAGTFSIKVTDANGASSTSCNITINGPLSVTCAAVNTGEVGIAFNSGPMTVSGGTAPYTYSVVGTLPAGLSLNTSTGAVTGTPTSAGTFSIKVTDANGASSTSCNITINGPLSVTCAAVNTGEVGIAFNSGPMTVSGGTAPYTYSVVGTLPAGLSLNTSTGAVTGTPTSAGTFSIKVTDANGASSTSCNITINGPLSVTCAAVNTGEVGIAFNSGPMTVSGGTAPYTYSVVGTLPAGLSLNTSTGAVTGTPTSAGTFSIKVTDANGASSTSCNITINGPLSVTCAAVNTGEVGIAFNSGPMTVSGGTAPYTYSVVGTLPAGLSLNTSTGAVTGTPTSAGTFSIKVTDANGASSTSCNITINGPLSVTCAAVNTGEVGIAFNSGPMTVSGGTAPYTYSVVGTLPAGLSLNTSTGAVTGTPTSAGTFSIKVTDANGASSTSCNITINGPLSVTCAAVNTGEVGIAFNSGPMTVSGGTAPYTYSVVGTQPAGLSLNTSTGAVTGTPTSAGTFSIKVTDANGASSTSCNITINGPLSVTCAAVNTGEVGVVFNSGPMTVSGGTAPYTYSVVGTQPAGLSLNTSTGAVTGTPTSAGTFSIKVTDANGASSTSCNITINGPLSVTCAAVNTGEVGIAFNSGPMTVSGGTAPYTYSVVGTQPAGLSLNTSTGAVTGTPTSAGTFSIKVTDANGASSTSCNITINGPLSVTCAAVNTGEVGVVFNSGPMTVSGGTAPYTYSVVGTQPAGLSLNTSTGAVTGTPTSAGTFSIKVTDANGASSTSCNITINGPLSVTCAATNTGEVGVAFNSGPMTVSGGTAPYTYSVVGTLPAGLTLNTSTGAVTGTPTSAGTFSIKVTDANGASSTSCNITINGPLSVTCAAVNTGEVGIAFNSGPMTVSGGTAPYTYSVVGTQPAGLSLNTSTGAVTGTPTSAGTFSIKVTDANGASSTSCNITINGPLSVTCAATNTGEVGVAFNSGPMTVSGGTAPYTYSVVGTLPAGLTLNTSTGAVTGTPTSAGTFSIKVTDANGASSTSCNITINGPLSVTCAAINTGEVGVAFNSGPMTVSGGTAPYTYSVVGTLPAGLTLNTSTGAVTGTPTASGTFSIKVTDAKGATNTACAILINPGVPSLQVTKTADNATVTAGSLAGFTVTISNAGTAPATSLVLNDPLPGGGGNDIQWAIDSTVGNPASFTITGAMGNQVLALVGSSNLAPAASLSVHITGTTTASDLTTSTNPAFNVGGLAGYVVLYEGTGNNQLSISNDTISGNIGVEGGKVAYSGPGKILGRLDFAGANTGQYANTNGSNVGPTSVNYSVAAVTTDANTINTLSTSLGALTGTTLNSINNNSLTINESSGTLGTYNGVTYRVFNVTSYSENNSGTLTINGDGSGNPVVFNFAGNSNTNLGGQVVLTGGLTPDQVIWNFTSSGKQVQLNNNGGTYQGVIIAPNDQYQSDSSNLKGRVYGGSAGNMQIVSGANVFAPPMTGTLPNTATVSASNAASVQATATITINPANSALSVTCAAVTSGEVGVAFNSGPMSVSGGTAPYTYSVVGTLPAGLTLNTSTGAVTGTPTASGAFSIKVTDADGASTTSCNITIASGFSVVCAANPSGSVGTPFDSGPMMVSSGVAPYTYSIVGTLPGGLTLNASTGAVTGTPTAAGLFHVSVADAAGASNSACAIAIAAGVPIGPGDTATIGFWHNQNGQALINAMNGGPTSTSLATWLATTFPYLYGANSANDLSGKTNADVAALDVTFFNGTAPKTSAQVLGGALAAYVTSSNLAGSDVAVSYGFNFSTTGTGAKVYNVASDGSSAGLVNNFSYTVVQLLQQANLETQLGTFDATAFNNIFSNINQNGDINGGAGTSNPTLSVTCPAVNSGALNTPFSSGAITVTGGTAPYTFSVVGTLPAGLTLNISTGAITGIPTTASSFYIKATDANGDIGTTNCAFNIGAGYTLIVNPSNITVVAGQSAVVTFTFTPVGGYVGTVNFTCAGLPVGTTCTFTPSTLIANGSNAVQTSTLTITTTASGITTIAANKTTSNTSLSGFFFLPALLLGCLISIRRKAFTARLRAFMLLLLAGATLVGGAVGCSSIVLSPTPLGSHVVTVVTQASASTSTSGSSSSTQSVTFTLTVVQ